VYHEVTFDLHDYIEFQEGQELQIVGMEHIIQDNMAAHVHHFTVILKAEDSSADLFVWAWAGGVPPQAMPAECGFAISSGTYRYVEIQTHYDNVFGVNIGELDESGVAFYVTSQLREHNCGVVQFGDPQLILGTQFEQGKTKTSFTCPSTCVPEGITMFASLLHMHYIGYQMWTDIYSGDTKLEELDRVDFWNATLQPVTTFSREVQSEESFQTHCIHNSPEGEEIWGSASNDEMCIHFVHYYPAVESFQHCGLGACGSLESSSETFTDRRTFGDSCDGEEPTPSASACLSSPVVALVMMGLAAVANRLH
jgi:hypothetical protein